MAYSGRFNPDALPAHVEPNEAAQIIADAQAAHAKVSPNLKPVKTSPTPPGQPKPRTNSTSSYHNKPPPPLPGSPTQQQYAYRPPSVGNAAMAGPPTPTFRPHSTSISGPPPARNNSPPSINSSPWVSSIYSGSPMPGTAPGSVVPTSMQAYNLGSASAYQIASPNQRPHSPLPPAGTHDPSLWPLFMAVDVRRTGQLTQTELSSALKNDEYTSFDPETVRMMIKMFDTNGNGTIGYEEFCGLWGFLAAWRTLFQRFDEDRSGFISYAEYSNALTAFGYNLSPEFVTMMYGIYDRKRDGRMTFDLFVQSCIQLKRMTDTFKKYDTDRDGFITLSFEDFLTEILNIR